jgi:thiopurine S-methyltransferase
LQPEFWHERWRMGQTGFHQSAVDRNLRQYWPELGVPIHGRVFVPLCGKSLDLLWLCERGHFVTGVELSSVALESFCMERGVPAKRRVAGDFDVYEAPNLQLFRGDFFALTRELLGPIPSVYDRAALISWTPELRAVYVNHITELTTPGTQILLVTMEYPQAQMTGPPFSMPAEDIHQLYARNFDIRWLGRQDILSSEPRLRGRGLTELYEVCYRLTRF